MARDVASRFNHQMGETFVLPKAKVEKNTMYVPGTNGGKMSKSQGNIIDIFVEDKKLRKQIMKIETDSTPIEDPKNPDTCNLFGLFKLIASEKEIAEMRANYEKGNYGYGHAKQAYYELLLKKFSKERERYSYYMNNLSEIDKALAIGAEKAKIIAAAVLERTRKKLGF